MVFSSNIFLFWFLPLFLVLYYASPRRGKSLIIGLSSYVFYGWWRPDFVLLMLLTSSLDFATGLLIGRDHARGRSGKRWLVPSIVLNLALLGYFKYANFGIDTLNVLLESFDQRIIQVAQIVLPVGISFYTFQSMSYTIDVYRREVPPDHNLLDFLCYVALFPQLVAGPIVRYRDIAKELKERTHTLQKFFEGTLYLQVGLAKKILIADNLAEVANAAFDESHRSILDSWTGITAYAFQIYFDFSGYSDMAIGLGLMLGFHFLANFDSPYRSISITDFWRRWHISLSTWLRDYLYVPLGGNRKGPIRTYFNLAATMLLGGLWHGAAWTFIAWGAYQGFWLIVERVFGRRSLFAFVPRPLQIVLTFVLVLVGWVFFRAADLPSALAYIGDMFSIRSHAVESRLDLDRLHIAAFIVGCVVVWFMPTTQSLVAKQRPAWVLAVQPIFLLAVLHLQYEDYVPFLYFQF